MKPYLPLVLVAVVEASSGVSYTSDVMAILLAMLSAACIQWSQERTHPLTTKAAVAEIVAGGLVGFMVHALVLIKSEDPRLVWSAACAAGAGGAKALEKANKWFQVNKP